MMRQHSTFLWARDEEASIGHCILHDHVKSDRGKRAADSKEKQRLLSLALAFTARIKVCEKLQLKPVAEV